MEWTSIRGSTRPRIWPRATPSVHADRDQQVSAGAGGVRGERALAYLSSRLERLPGPLYNLWKVRRGRCQPGTGAGPRREGTLPLTGWAALAVAVALLAEASVMAT